MGRLSLALIFCLPLLGDPAGAADADAEAPSEAFLEFLGELEPVDEETWKLLEEHARRDLPRNEEVSSE